MLHLFFQRAKVDAIVFLCLRTTDEVVKEVLTGTMYFALGNASHVISPAQVVGSLEDQIEN